jgi:hypothetical protein
MSEDPTGSIEGVIALKGTDTPIPGVQVTVHRSRSTFNAITSTDADGRFFIENLAPGHYVIHAYRDGYLDMRIAHAEVSPGQNTRLANLYMALGATIRGRILHASGRPVVGRSVEFLELTNNVEGHREWQTRGRMAFTDSVGDYKNSRLDPGEYYIRLSAMPSGEELPNRSDDLAIAYFPGTAGEEVIASFTVPDRATYNVSGKVISFLPNMDSLPRLNCGLALKDSAGPLEEGPVPVASVTLPGGSTGDFEFRGIPSGDYDLFAIALTPTSDYLGKVSLQVQDQDVRDVRVPLRPGQDVTGRLIIEDGQDLGLQIAPGALAKLPPIDPDKGFVVYGRSSGGRQDISLKLERTDGFRGGRYSFGPLVSEAGTEFTFPNVPKGSYRISARGFPLMPMRSDTYLADIRLGGRSILEVGVFEIGSEPVAPIEVIVGTNGGSVHGTFRDKGSEKAQLLLIPEPRLRTTASLFFLVTLAEAQREFHFYGMAPGDYKLLALRTADRSIPFQSAEFLSRFEPVATAISIQKGVRLSGLELSLAAYG